jgi:hypothetical protein
MLVGAAGVGYLAYQDSSDYKTALNHVTTQGELDRLSSGARDKALVSDVLLGTGVAGAALTVILLLTGGTRETASGAETKSSVQLSGRGVTLQF